MHDACYSKLTSLGNIERLHAIYQALYEPLHGEEDKFFVQETTREKPDSWATVNANDPLAPWSYTKDGKRACYTSNDVKDWTKLGFATPGDHHLDAEERKQLAQYLRNTYYW